MWWLTAEESRLAELCTLHERLGGRLSRMLQSESKLSSADFAVLVSPTDVPDGRQRYQDLARALEWEKSRMFHHIARMAGRGLVIREECSEDARGAFVVITDAGRVAIEAAAPLHVEAVRELFLAMSPRRNCGLCPTHLRPSGGEAGRGPRLIGRSRCYLAAKAS